MKEYKLIKSVCVSSILALSSISAMAYVSEVWNPDLGNGKYKNPVINADYSDPDVTRVGDDYYMVASSFTCIPALPILQSNDMVNWTIVGAAATELPDPAFDLPSHGNGVWAPSIRYHNGEYYVCYGDPDRGIYIIKTRDPKGAWDEPMLIYPASGVIDPCPFWDEDGKAYIAHGYAGSRAGLKSIIGMIEMMPDGTGVIGKDRIIYDGHLENETIEGAKMYKKGDWYYIFSPAGGVSTGWQEVLRSKNPWGPYEVRNVMEQGETDINGPHQGAWVDTPDGQEDWFFHFQDKGPYGRVVHLQPMAWAEDGWPVIGVDKDGDGRGEPVTTYRKPNVGKTYPNANPVESDDFDGLVIGPQWQWNANPQPLWHHCDAKAGMIRLFSHYTPSAKSLYDIPNMLLQKFPAENFTATAKVQLHPNTKNGENMVGEKGGLVVMGYDYADIALESRKDGIYLIQGDCVKASKGAEETQVAEAKISDGGESPWVYLRVKITRTGVKKPRAKEDYTCQAEFSYSLDGKKYTSIGRPFKVIEGHWIGAKVGLFCIRPWKINDSGWLNVDWFKITK